MRLELDTRQRAMLHEMGVHVWLPEPAQTAKTIEPIQPAPVVVAQTLSKTIANNAAPTRANGQNDAQKDSGALPSDVSALGWADLQQAAARCQACPLHTGRQHSVFGSGITPTGAVDWLIVGSPPDEDEDRAGQPFAGDAGKLLDNMLKAMGASRVSNASLVNIVKCRPPGNRNPELAEIKQCEHFLRRQIALLQPKVILAMGRFAVHALLLPSIPEVASIPPGKLRGQVHHYALTGHAIPVIATDHPHALLRNPMGKARAWADLCLAMDVMKGLGR
jgi:uracil-DNA glycosylase